MLYLIRRERFIMLGHFEACLNENIKCRHLKKKNLSGNTATNPGFYQINGMIFKAGNTWATVSM